MNKKTERLAGKKYMAKQIRRAEMTWQEKRLRRAELRLKTGCKNKLLK